MTTKHLSLALGIVAGCAITLIGCKTTKTQTKTQTQTSTQTQTMAQTITKANTEEDFAFAMLKQSLTKQENVFLSPASAAVALGMLTPGADGQTRQELEKIVPKVVITNTDQLKSASAMWLNEGFEVLPQYKQANADAEVYAGKITAPKVNKWASDHTNGKITKVLQEPMPRYEMILTNALWFKAEWQHTFFPQNTKKETFYGESVNRGIGESVNRGTECMMMHQTTHFPYTENDNLQAIRMDYTSEYCMDIILPREGKQISEVLTEVQALKLSEMDYKKVRLTLPKFKLEYERTLNDDLKAMGLQTCFSRQADFSLLSKTPVYVDIVKQNTYLAVDEEGTEAAAVTTIAMKAMAMPPRDEPIYEMNINRPFLLFIRETDTNRILFFGTIYDISE